MNNSYVRLQFAGRTTPAFHSKTPQTVAYCRRVLTYFSFIIIAFFIQTVLDLVVTQSMLFATSVLKKSIYF